MLEKALAVDNVFVWLMLFSYFAIPSNLQRRVLIYGVLGAIVLRTIMIFAGSWLVTFSWILYIFGAFLLFTGIKMAFAKEGDDAAVGDKPVVRWLRKHLRMTDELHGESSSPAKRRAVCHTAAAGADYGGAERCYFRCRQYSGYFAVTTDPFIVLTSNLFAILGLRAMLPAGQRGERFSMLKYGLAIVLVFIGIKMLIVEFYHIPVAISLTVVG